MNKSDKYKMRKRLIICAIILLVISVCIVVVFLQTNKPPEHIKRMLEDNKESYDYVANFYYDDFKNNKTSCLSYSFLENDTLVCYESLFDSREVSLDETEIDIFKIVDKSYYVDDKTVDRVYVYENFVALCNENGRASIVYSIDGTAPKWIDGPKEELDRIKVVKILANWYYVIAY
jgi:hypothetical protein